MDGKDDDFPHGFGIFGGMFQNIFRSFDEELKQVMEEMSNMGFHTPEGPGGSVPSYGRSPREMMLKDPDDDGQKRCFLQDQRVGLFSPVHRSTSIKRLADGTVEKIEKVTENGRTCTTVTHTDKNGVMTSNTTCDRPAAGDVPTLLKNDSPPAIMPPEPSQSQGSGITSKPPQPGMDAEEAGFFNKLFGFDIFKSRK
ncbi:hypothetical protein MAR_004457 [Mya arenaria]|uniref:Uncharacterized protein n=1 Tax=Mya arenaria TaxID=6604 RepID=A0ABY7EZQ6_MYAAR|nr:hypothetical protein MAR_004457 [Mya arenaria]